MRIREENQEKKISFIELPELRKQLVNIIEEEKNKHLATLIYNPNSIGKSVMLEKIINELAGNKIIINFSDDTYKSGFPAKVIVDTIYDKLEEYNIEFKGDYPKISETDEVTCLEDLKDSELAMLVVDLYNLKLDKPLYIVLNDIQNVYDNDFSLTFFKHFLFDKRDLPNNLYVFLTTNNKEQIHYLKYLHVEEIKELDDEKEIFVKLLNANGIPIGLNFLDYANPNLGLNEYFYIARLVTEYGVGPNVVAKLITLNNTDELLGNIFDFFASRMSKVAQAVFAEAMLDLYMFLPGLEEEQILNSINYVFHSENHYLASYNELSKEEQLNIIWSLMYFTEKEGNRLCIKDRVIKEFIGRNASILLDIVEFAFEQRFNNAVEFIYSQTDKIAKYGMKLTKEGYIREYKLHNKNKNKYLLFDPLCYRLQNNILDYAKEIETYLNFDFEVINDEEMLFITYLDYATQIYLNGGYYGFLGDIIHNKYLMYFVNTKSQRLARRILNRLIESYIDYEKQNFKSSKIDLDAIAVIVASLLEYLFDKEEHELLSLIQNNLLATLSLALKERNVLTNGKLKDAVLNMQTDLMDEYIVNNCYDLYELFYQISEEQSMPKLHKQLDDLAELYNDDEEVAHKLVYAYLALKTFIKIGDRRELNDLDHEAVMKILETLMMYKEYCYYPEVYAIFDILEARMWPEDRLEQLKDGLNVLKKLGFEKELEPFVEVYKYYMAKNR